MIAFSTLGGAHPEKPTSYCLESTLGNEIAILIGGDLRTIHAVRDFWQLVIQTIESAPKSIWLNLTGVCQADTKLAACIVAILRRAHTKGIDVFIVGSDAVQDTLKLCKVPPLKHFTKAA